MTRVQGFGFRFWGFGFRVSVQWFRARSFGFRISGFGSGVSGSEFQLSGVWGFGFRLGLGPAKFGIWGFGCGGCRVWGADASFGIRAGFGIRDAGFGIRVWGLRVTSLIGCPTKFSHQSCSSSASRRSMNNFRSEKSESCEDPSRLDSRDSDPGSRDPDPGRSRSSPRSPRGAGDPGIASQAQCETDRKEKPICRQGLGLRVNGIGDRV